MSIRVLTHLVEESKGKLCFKASVNKILHDLRVKANNDTDYDVDRKALTFIFLLYPILDMRFDIPKEVSS